MKMESYLTIKHQSVIKQTISKSEFIGLAFPVENEPDIITHLTTAKHQFTGASHYVYAYSLGRKQSSQKFSDDGEPSGTAGMPILELIRHKQIEDALLIVIRYYGGVKLGTGGLKRAYSHTAQSALETAGICRMVPCRIIRVQISYSYWDKIQREFEHFRISPDHIAYEAEITALIAVPVQQFGHITERLNEITASNLNILIEKEEYRPSNGD